MTRAAPARITQASEHPAVLEACRALQRLHGIQVRYLPVDREGLVDPAALAEALTPDTVLVSIMAANNETGVLQPITELAGIAHARGVLFHTDVAQAAGKIPIDATAWGVDLLTIAGHKMYAPKGIGALYVRSGERLEPIVYGGGQERGLRAGTESVALAVALGAAAQLARTELDAGGADRIRSLRNLLHDNSMSCCPDGSSSTGIATGGCRTPSTSASPGFAAMTCWPPPQASPRPPARPAIPARRSPRPYCWP